MEEARAVQEFLTAVEGEVEEEITDDMTAEQLLEKLERLEMLQETQSSREGEVKAIDQSADSEEVKKALQKNPDISKERNNLLQGAVFFVCDKVMQSWAHEACVIGSEERDHFALWPNFFFFFLSAHNFKAVIATGLNIEHSYTL